jgi:hypothetical protein
MLEALRMFKQSPSVALYDSAAGDAIQAIGASAIDKRATLAGTQEMRKVGLSIVIELAESITENALDTDETPSERLDALMSGALGLDDDESDNALVPLLSEHMVDALSGFKVPVAMIADAFGENSDVADSAIDQMSEIVIANLPSKGAELDDFIKDFVYGFSEPDMSDADSSDEVEEYDSMGKPKKKLGVGQKTTKKVNGHTLQYKAVKAVRHGKIVTVNKRIGGTVVLTASQKAAVHKLHAKPRTSSMMKMAMRSLVKGKKANIY